MLEPYSHIQLAQPDLEHDPVDPTLLGEPKDQLLQEVPFFESNTKGEEDAPPPSSNFSTEPEVTTDTLPNFFQGIANDKLPDPSGLFRETTAALVYYQYVVASLAKGIVPTRAQVQQHVLGKGFTLSNYNSANAYVGTKLRSLPMLREQAEPIPKNGVQKKPQRVGPPDENTYFKDIPNDQLPDPDDLCQEGTQMYMYYSHVFEAVMNGETPNMAKIEDQLRKIGFTDTNLKSAKRSLLRKLEEHVGPSFDRWRSRVEMVRPTGIPSASHQGFPVFSAPERNETNKQQDYSPQDQALRARINGMAPVEKAAAEAIFDTKPGKSISQEKWADSTGIHTSDLPRLIAELKESGIVVQTYMSQGVQYYFRKSANS